MVTSTVPETERQVATVRDLTRRVQAEYTEMPGLSVTLPQAQRLLGIDRETCVVVIRTLVDRRFLRRTARGQVRSVLSRRSVIDHARQGHRLRCTPQLQRFDARPLTLSLVVAAVR